jgi:hypothetical protein
VGVLLLAGLILRRAYPVPHGLVVDGLVVDPPDDGPHWRHRKRPGVRLRRVHNRTPRV